MSWLLALYPRHVRDRFGAGMRTAFAEDYARARAPRVACRAGLHRDDRRSHARSPGSPSACHAWRRSARSCLPTCATPSARCARRRWSRSSRCCRWRSGSAPTRRSFRSSTASCSSRCRSPSRSGSPSLVGNDWTNPIWEQIRERERSYSTAPSPGRPSDSTLRPPAPRIQSTAATSAAAMFRHARRSARRVGAPLTPADDVRGGGPDGYVAVVSHRFWQQRFGGSDDVLGQRLTINGVPFTIVGVAPGGIPRPGSRAADGRVPSARRRGRDPRRGVDARQPIQLVAAGDGPAQARADRLEKADSGAQRARLATIRDATLPPGASAERRARYLKEPFILAGAASGVSSAAEPLRAAADDHHDRGRGGAADRVRQHRQPDAGAGHRPAGTR